MHGVTDCKPMMFAILQQVACPVFLDLFQGGRSSGWGPVVLHKISAEEVGDVKRNLNA